jgi:hypothetical protein
VTPIDVTRAARARRPAAGRAQLKIHIPKPER